MKADLIVMERSAKKLPDFSFISDIAQRGRIRPATFIHEFQMPFSIFEEMKDSRLIDIIYLTQRERDDNGRTHDPIAHFEIKDKTVIACFHHIYNREDFRSMVDRYLIIKAYGRYPCKANWVSKMNFDKSIEAVQHVFNKKIKGNDFRTITLKSDL
jgi:hypothetical protein